MTAANQHQRRQQYSSRNPEQPVCTCGRGHGSKFDGLCSSCRKRQGKPALAAFRAWQLAQQPVEVK